MKYIGPEDQFIVVGDGPLPQVREWVGTFPRVLYLETPYRIGDFGSSPCDLGTLSATGDMIWYVGDDDMIEPDVFETIREKVAGLTHRPHIFAMVHSGRVLRYSMDLARVSGQQIVVPNDADLPKMAGQDPMDQQPNDWRFISNVTGKFGPPLYHKELICVLDRMNQGAML